MARKKEHRKSQYHEFSNTFNKNHSTKGKWHTLFGNDNPVTFELGCGKAAFSWEMARRYPERNFVGVDLKADRLWKPAGEALEAGIKNLAFLCVHLMKLEDFVDQGEASEIWITFPDPFPKKRQAKHRMVNQAFLKIYENVLAPEGKFCLKTDNLEFFHFALEQMVEKGNTRFRELSFDLHEDERIGDDAKIQTDYERKFIGMGKSINYFCAEFKK